MIDETLYNELMKSCDERIACIKQNIKSTHGKILFCLLGNIEEPMEGNEIYLRWTQATLKIVQIEKMIYEAIYSQTKPFTSFLLKKFDECLVETCEISEALVRVGITKEIRHLEYTKKTIPQHEFMTLLCELHS